MPEEYTESGKGGALYLPGKLAHFLWKKFAIARDEQRCKISC